MVSPMQSLTQCQAHVNFSVNGRCCYCYMLPFSSTYSSAVPYFNTVAHIFNVQFGSVSHLGKQKVYFAFSLAVLRGLSPLVIRWLPWRRWSVVSLYHSLSCCMFFNLAFPVLNNVPPSVLFLASWLTRHSAKGNFFFPLPIFLSLPAGSNGIQPAEQLSALLQIASTERPLKSAFRFTTRRGFCHFSINSQENAETIFVAGLQL